MSLSPGIELLSRQKKPFLLPSPAFEQQVFSQQNRPSIQRRRYLLPTPVHQPFVQHRRNFLPPFRAPHPFILHNRNRAHLWGHRMNVYPSPRYSWHHPSMKRNTEDQFAMRNCRFPTNVNTWEHPVQEDTVPSFTGRQNFSNVVNNKIIPIDFVRGDDQNSQEDIIQEENLIIKTGDTNEKLGEWEKHTKGIGTKLLLKMGFEPGKGIGKHLQGRTQPVKATDWKENNGKEVIASDPLELSYPAQQSVNRWQSSNDLRSPSSYRIAISPTPEVISISSSDEEDYLIVDDDEYFPDVPRRKKNLSEWPWTNNETSCSSSIPASLPFPEEVEEVASSVISVGSPDIVYISSSDEDECVVPIP